jgi:hypothetical protein
MIWFNIMVQTRCPLAKSPSAGMDGDTNLKLWNIEFIAQIAINTIFILL